MPNTNPTRRQTPTRIAILAVAILMIAAACSSDSSDDEPTASTTTVPGATTTAGEGATTTATAAGDDGGGDAGSDASGDTEYAIVTIGSETFEADMSGSLAACIAIGGAVGGVGQIVEPGSGTIDMTIPPENWESSPDDWGPPSIRVDLGEDENGVPIDWRAGGDIVESMPDLVGKSQVDSFSIDGATATGTATFIDFFQVQLAGGGQVDDPEPVEGTFEINCG